MTQTLGCYACCNVFSLLYVYSQTLVVGGFHGSLLLLVICLLQGVSACALVLLAYLSPHAAVSCSYCQHGDAIDRHPERD